MKSRTVQLGQVCEFIRGVTFDKAEATTRPERGKTPILRAGNISDELDAENDLIWVPDGHVDDEQRLRRNDIAICMSSGSSEVVGKTARVQCDLRASIGSFCGIIRPRCPDEAAYLSYFFRSPAFRKHRDAVARGANIQNLRFSEFEEIRLEIPDEQRRIAERLEQADRLRRMRRYALELTDTILPAAFLELFGDPSSNPKGWMIQTLSSVCNGISDIDHNMPKAVERGIPFISAKDLLDDGRISFENVKMISEEDFRRLSRKSLPQRGDIIYSRIGVDLGKARMVDVDSQFLASYSCCTIKPNGNLVDPLFLCFLLDSPSTLRQAHGGVRAIAVPDLGLKEIMKFRIINPPLSLQKEFAGLVERVERLRATQREALRQADHLFASLLHHAFAPTG